MLYGKIKMNENIFIEGDVSNSFFILESGMMEVIISGKVLILNRKKE